MIIDTSALTAIAQGEAGWEALRTAMLSSNCVAPAPVITELALVLGSKPDRVQEAARGLVDELINMGMQVVPFDHRHAEITKIAREHYGRANGSGGLLNFGDLMVYAVAKQRGEPLLCTGRDFASTDLEIHSASRLDQ